jgi:phospholipase A1
MKSSSARWRPFFAIGYVCVGAMLLLAFPGEALAERLPAAAADLAECSGIKDDAARLRCYDSLAGRKLEEPSPATAEKPREERGKSFSYFSQLWQLEPETCRERSPITIYRSNYFLPYTYNGSPNEEPVRQADPDKTVENEEAVFQLSFKFKLWPDVLGKDLDLWIAYTQRSFWQVYNFDDSSPFRETDYEPELLFNFRTDYRILGLRGRFVNVGFNHQSNGRSEPLSRSWNRIVANAGFERGDFSLLLRAWYRIPESDANDDNPEIEDYLGYGEAWAYYFWKGNRFGIMLRDNLDFSDNRGAVQLEWSLPIFENVNGYVQYFTGYGESLLDYNHRSNRIGIGFMLKNWE